MKKEEVIRKFVQINYELLANRAHFDRKLYKDIKKSYFGKKLQWRVGNPRDREICTHLVDFIMNTQKVSNKDTLEQIILKTPFLKLNNIRADDFIAPISLIARKYAIKEQINNLSEVEKHDKLVEWITKERAAEIDETIRKKEEEYRRLPSILDDTDFDEPKELPKEEEVKEWWEELGLREDPFPGALDGFSLIDKSLYDEIVVETLPIQWALNKIEKGEHLDIFHKGFLLGGEFGTGKTTFYDFMAPHLTMKHIEPIRIAASENISVAHYVQKFEKALCVKISKIAKKYNISGASRVFDFEEARLLMIEIQDTGTKGFFIFIDDLHKHTDRDRVFSFLANLQITKNIFSRDNINAVFVVSGFPWWREKIRRDSALTGFFDAADELTLPEVTPQLAAHAIEKRLHAFAINPDKDLAVKEDFLKTIFRRVSSEIGRSNIGFRPYIHEAVKKFQLRQFDILSVDFTRLDENIMKEVRLVLESNKDFKRNIDKLVFGGRIKKREMRELTLKVLCEVYLRKGIFEDDEIFETNIFSFKRLSECDLIQKYDREDELVWKVTPLVAELNSEIINQYNLSMEDYLVPIYSIPSSKPVEVKWVTNRLEEFEQDLKQLSRNLDKSLFAGVKHVLKMYSENIFPYVKAGSKRSYSQEEMPEVDKIRDCIWTMMKNVLRYESPLLLEVCGEHNILGWTLRHRTLEYCEHFISIQEKLADGMSEHGDITRLISFANDAFEELWGEFKESINVYQATNVKCYELPRKVLKTIYSEYQNLFLMRHLRKEYFQALNKFIQMTEEIIREYLFVSTTLILGPFHVRVKHYPENIRKYIRKDVPTSSTSYEAYNEFENLNRGQYRDLLTKTGKSSVFYRFIIKPLIEKWDSQDIQSFLQLFGEINIISGHTKTISVEDIKKDVPTFFRLTCRFISEISRRLKELVLRDNIILLSKDNVAVVFGHRLEKNQETKKIVKMADVSRLPDCLYHHKIQTSLLANGINKVMENSDNAFGAPELDLLDIEESRIKCNMNYCEAIAIIANCVANNSIRVIPLYGTNICLEKI